jgi:F0F1-type ATP synthase assembly protein I
MIAFIIGLLIGFVAGALVFRKHAAKAAALEVKAKSIADEFMHK